MPANSTLVRLTPTSLGADIYLATPIDPNLGIWPGPGPLPHPEHPIYYPPGIWGPTDPRPGWGLPGPQPPLPGTPPTEPTSDWIFQDGGWYFKSGPYDRPRPICGTSNRETGDPVKAKWVFLDDGWWFVSGPFDKPRSVCGAEVPPDVPTEPPTEPPTGAEGDWKYQDGGWYFCYGPLDKPQPMPPDGGNGEPPPLPPGA